MSGPFRLIRTLHHSTIREFMRFTARLAPPSGSDKPLGWWDGGYTGKPREKVSQYDFGYPPMTVGTEKGKVSEGSTLWEKSQ